MQKSWLLLGFLLPFGLFAQDWTYIRLDSTRAKWGDTAKPTWLRYFGLATGDLNGDGQPDIVAGRYVYLFDHSGPQLRWQRVDLGQNVDGILIMDVDGDTFPDLIAQALPAVHWFEALDPGGTTWTSRVVAHISPCHHVNSQGFAQADIFAGGRPEVIIANEDSIFALEIPTDAPDEQPWRKVLIATPATDEGIGVGDIDGDGDLDLAGGVRAGKEPKYVYWFENPGHDTGDWRAHLVGETRHAGDRFAIGDINGDGRADIVVAEERYPGLEPDASLYWYAQPADPAQPWTRHRVVTQYSMNNLEVTDMDGDGDLDLLTAEHKGPFLQLQLWQNDGHGHFTKQVLDQGKECHLGAKTFDLEGDGDRDIVGIGWDVYQDLHLWRQEASPALQIRWWYGDTLHLGRPGLTQRWANVLGTIHSDDTVLQAQYRLDGGPPRPLGLGPDGRRLARRGDFNCEIPFAELGEGYHQVTVTAVDARGRHASQTCWLHVTHGQRWPLPYHIDWQTVKDLTEVVHVIDGHWDLSQAGVRTRAPYYDRILSLGDSTWVNYEITAEVTLHAHAAPTLGPPTFGVSHFAVASRWPGHTPDGEQPSVQWYPLGATGEFTLNAALDSCRFRFLGGEKGRAYSTVYHALEPGRRYWIKHQVQDLSPTRTRYRSKLWPADEPEPAAWDLIYLKDPSDITRGCALLLAHNTDVTFGNIHVIPLPAAPAAE